MSCPSCPDRPEGAHVGGSVQILPHQTCPANWSRGSTESQWSSCRYVAPILSSEPPSAPQLGVESTPQLPHCLR
eukprot:8712822-Pyramimonas_sp.AAC.1